MPVENSEPMNQYPGKSVAKKYARCLFTAFSGKVVILNPEQSDKTALRKQFLHQRKQNLWPDSRHHNICQNILTWLAEHKTIRRIFGYSGFNGEVKSELLQKQLPGYFQFFLPVILSPGEMAFYLWQGETLIQNHFGIYEPVTKGKNPETPSDQDLILLPALAVDHSGYRLGYGGGYYDRFLARRMTAIRMAVIWQEFLIASSLPRDPWDIPADWIVSDAGVIQTVSVR
ncbi:MAG: 5-formyltetrahydrofolate cyclo-ligase [Deltaproteobacteria bacterium]|nr:5-formyltetrahydrofolate cyclo-ligase [Deltaproteobacteria bacterium]